MGEEGDRSVATIFPDWQVPSKWTDFIALNAEMAPPVRRFGDESTASLTTHSPRR